MANHSSFFVWLLLTTMGCAVPAPNPPDESEARRHLSRAESLEKASALPEAAVEYAFVAEHYPSTSCFPEAVRKAALLYSMPSNPAADESSALRWMQTYRALPLTAEEKQHVELHIVLLQQLLSLKNSRARETNSREKLSALATRRGADLLALAKRIQELEAELHRVSQELEGLKEVDVQTIRKRAQK